MSRNELLELIEDSQYIELKMRILDGRAQDLINTPNEHGELPIHAVTDFSQYISDEGEELDLIEKNILNEIAILLIERGAKLDIPYEGMLPIHHVCTRYNGSEEVLAAMLATGQNNRDVLDAAGLPPLFYAVEAGNIKQMNLLGVHHDPIRDKTAATPLLIQYPSNTKNQFPNNSHQTSSRSSSVKKIEKRY